MILIDLPYGTDILLTPRVKLPVTKGKSPHGPQGLTLPGYGVVSVAAPASTRVTNDMVKSDPEAAAFLQSETSCDFHLVNFACTFVDSAREPFEEAQVGVSLTTPAIAWSMRPIRDTDLIEQSLSVKIDGKIKLVSGEEPGGGLEVGRKSSQQADFIAAFNLGQSIVFWKLRRTPVRHINGSYPLSLVVRRPTDTVVTVAVSVNALVRKTRAWFFQSTDQTESQAVSIVLK